ncbi:MAG: hypothetical protein OJF52_003283 [Nitrospira sp.]|nr:MAG: hypothetical protein OJF52_003283 [Nitrospira sp.]
MEDLIEAHGTGSPMAVNNKKARTTHQGIVRALERNARWPLVLLKRQ